MLTGILIAISILLLLLLLATLNTLRTQHSTVVSVVHLLSSFAAGEFGRRADPWAKGAAGELARTSNKLADELETRTATAQQDKDHLLSLLAVLDHTNEIA